MTPEETLRICSVEDARTVGKVWKIHTIVQHFLSEIWQKYISQVDMCQPARLRKFMEIGLYFLCIFTNTYWVSSSVLQADSTLLKMGTQVAVP